MNNLQSLNSAVVLAVALILFLCLVYALFAFLRLIWTRVPVQILSIHGEHLDRLLAVIIALSIVPNVAWFAWQTAYNFFSFVGMQIRQMGNPTFGSENITAFIGELAYGLVQSLNLLGFPIREFVQFLLLALVLSLIFAQIRSGISTGRISDWAGTANKWFPKESRERFVFTLLVLVAFYLGLAALLAIPLFQDKSRPQNLTVEALDKALEPNVIRTTEFDKLFVADLPPIREIAALKLADGLDPRLATDISNLFNSRKDMLSKPSAELQDSWSSLRQSALADQTNLREQAKSAFASGLEVGIGRKQSAEHYYDLFRWHQSVMSKIQNALRSCQSRSLTFNTGVSQALESLRTRLQSITEQSDYARASIDIREHLTDLYTVYENARSACRGVIDDERTNVPARKSFVESLGTIGIWSGWLLSTEQMPLVIIVGLVGFSLLGATVSRAIRTSQANEGSFARLTLDDLVFVIAVGATAAVIVFLAAYGGMAVLGGNTGDPNPYVLFATCLIGAIYSEDVWTWARAHGVARQSRGGAVQTAPAGSSSTATPPTPSPLPSSPPRQRTSGAPRGTSARRRRTRVRQR